MQDILSHRITLNDGYEFPVVGLGVYQAKGQQLATAIEQAVEAGYRHIDCAALYGNEADVARILRDLGADTTEAVTVTTKIWNDDVRSGKTMEAVHRSLKITQREQLDVVLIHWPAEGYLRAWEALQNARAAGLIRSIGVSNFMPEHLDKLLADKPTVPCINQFEHHPYLPQQSAYERSRALGIFPVAHTPLMQGDFLREPTFSEIATTLGLTPARVLLRWNLQRGVGVIPKSVTPKRIRENIDLFGFSLSPDQMERIDQLNRDHRFSGDPYRMDF